MTFAGLLAMAPSSGQALEYVRSSINLPASTEAFETRFDLDQDGRKDAVAVFQRRVLVFFQAPDGRFSAVPDLEVGSGRPIPMDYAAVAIGKVTESPGLQLLLVGRAGVDYLTLTQLRGQGKEPVEPQSLLRREFDISSQSTLQFLDCVVDVDGDGRDDLVLPNSDLLEVYSRSKEGTYSRATSLNLPLKTIQRTSFDSEPVLLGSPLVEETASREFVQTLPNPGNRWHAARFSVETASDPFIVSDLNHDKRIDFLFPQNLFVQDRSGSFQVERSLLFSRIHEALSVQDRNVATVPNLVDFNGDGIMDTYRIEASTTKMSPRTDVMVYLGRPDRSLPETPDSVLRTRDFAYSEILPMGDLNGDGAVDIALLHLDFQPSSASSQFKAYLKNGLNGDLRFYIWDKKRNRFPDGHAFSHPILVNYDIYGTRQLFRQQISIAQDMDGDAMADLVYKTGPDEVSVFSNEGGKKPRIASSPAAVLRTTPMRFSSLAAAELNGDGRGDLIVTGYIDGNDDRVIYSLFVSR